MPLERATTQDSPKQLSVPRWVEFAPMILAFAGMAWLSWRKWPDPLIDFGMQLYVPWQLSNGAALYQDVAYLTGGPLSQLYHSFLFRIFGASFDTILVSNLLLLIVFLAFVYRRFCNSADRLTGTIITLGIIMGFAFAHYLPIGNYNFLSPYSHEAVHGLMLSILMIGFTADWLRQGKVHDAALAGFCFGLVFLTKPELLLSASAAVLTAIFLAYRQRAKQAGRSLLLFVAMAILPPFGLGLYFFQASGLTPAVKAICWAWIPLITTGAADNAFYRWCLGLDTPWLHLRGAALQFAGLCLVVLLLAWLCRGSFKTSRARISFVCAMGILALGSVFFDWTSCGRGLPLILASGLFLALWTKKRRSGQAFEVGPFAILWMVFGLILLAKLGLHCRIWHYGFYLALPAFAGAIYILLSLAPRFLMNYQTRPQLFRGCVCFLLLIGFLRLVAQSNVFYAEKTFALGEDRDRFFTYSPRIEPASRVIAETVLWLEQNTTETQTVACLPEGAMLNYLSRRSNSAPFLVFNPAETAAFGEPAMHAAYVEAPPDYILLVHRDTSEFGVDFFGRKPGFGFELMQWITNHYTTAQLIGYEPLQNHRFGIKILQRPADLGQQQPAQR